MLKGSQPSSSSSPPTGTVIESKGFVVVVVMIVVIKKKTSFIDFHANKVDNIHVHSKLQKLLLIPLAKKYSPFFIL